MLMVRFSTSAVPREQRLPLFRAGATSYDIDPVGDPLDFGADWQVLRLGDANVLRSTISGVRYRRGRDRIEVDGEDRFAFFRCRAGHSRGTIDGKAAAVGPGGAMVWDLTRPLDMTSAGALEIDIVTLPRYMIEEVIPARSFAGSLAAGPALTLVAEHLDYLFEHAADLPEEGASFQGRALRDMLAVAMYPLYRAQDAAEEPFAPAFRRICEVIDGDPRARVDQAGLADALALPIAEVAQTLARFGGLEEVIERRRLLAAYRLLSNPAETAPVSVIASRCGFTDMPRFSRRFRIVFQTTARDLRVYHRAHLPAWAGAYHLERNYEALIAG